LISGGFHDPTGAEPSPLKEKNLSPPLDKFLNMPLLKINIFESTVATSRKKKFKIVSN